MLKSLVDVEGVSKENPSLPATNPKVFKGRTPLKPGETFTGEWVAMDDSNLEAKK